MTDLFVFHCNGVCVLLLFQEKETLEELIHIVDAEKYSCHASSILDDTEDVTEGVQNMSVKNKKVCG